MKANINGTIQDYKPRPISKDDISDDIEINDVVLTPFDLRVFNAVSIVDKLKKCEVEYIDIDIYRLMGLDETTENFEKLEKSISKLIEAELLIVENVFSWGEKEDHAQADELPDGFTFIGTRSIEEQPDGRGVTNLGSADDYDQEETDSQLKDSVSYFMRKEMGGERALYEMLGVVSELFEEMAAFSKREYSDMETARSFSESAENCEIVRDVIANRNSRKR